MAQLACNYSQSGLAPVRSIPFIPSCLISDSFGVSWTSGHTREYHQEHDIRRDEIIYQTGVLVLATRESSIIRKHTQTTRTHTLQYRYTQRWTRRNTQVFSTIISLCLFICFVDSMQSIIRLLFCVCVCVYVPRGAVWRETRFLRSRAEPMSAWLEVHFDPSGIQVSGLHTHTHTRTHTRTHTLTYTHMLTHTHTHTHTHSGTYTLQSW